MPIFSSPEYDLFAFFFCLYLFYQLFMMTDGEGNGPVNLINHVYPNVSEQDKTKKKVKNNGSKTGDDDEDYTNKELFHMIKDLIKPNSGETGTREDFEALPEANQRGQQESPSQSRRQSRASTSERQGLKPAQPQASPASSQPQAVPALQPQPSAMIQPQPSAITQPQPSAITQPQPSAMIQPQPSAMTQPQPSAISQPQPSAISQPQPSAISQPQPSGISQPQIPPASQISAAQPGPDSTDQQ